jgi:hypothetical protein
MISLSGIILILSTVLLGLILFLALRTFGKSSNNGQLIVPSISAVGLPTAIENLIVATPATFSPSRTATLRATPKSDIRIDIDGLLKK